MASRLSDFFKTSKQHFVQARTEAEQFKTKELEALASISARINEQVEKVREGFKIIHAKEQVSDEALETFR